MNYSKLKKQLVEHEDLKLKPYRCTAGKLTIGVGRNLDDKGISKDEALEMLGNDIDEFYSEITKALPWFLKQPEIVQRILLDMAFNMGTKGLLTFKNTLKYIENRQYDKAADNMIQSRWYRQVGIRSVRLVEMMRRQQDVSYEEAEEIYRSKS